MKTRNRKTSLLISFALVLFLFVVNITSVYSWFNGQGYVGKTMSYSRSLYIGAADANVTNYHGYDDGLGNYTYLLINPLVGFQENNLMPSSFIHLRTDIENTSTTDDLYISLYLQEIVYDAPLHDYLYFGTNDPIIEKNIYKNLAVYDEQTDRYTLHSIPLLTNCMIEADTTLSLYWYVYIDSDAGNDIANTYINLGTVTLTYNS